MLTEAELRKMGPAAAITLLYELTATGQVSKDEFTTVMQTIVALTLEELDAFDDMTMDLPDDTVSGMLLGFTNPGIQH